MRVTPANEGLMKDDFDNGMGLPEDELTGSTSMSDPGDLGLGGMDAEDEMDSETPGRPSGGARARSSSSSRPGKRTVAAPAARKSASTGAKKKSASTAAKKKSAGRGAKKKGAKKSARAASRKPMRKAAKKATGGRKRKAGRKR
jgi:hypothetical protein